jgi:hypothetical protein
MMTELFVGKRSGLLLDDFITLLSSLTGSANWEQRASSNYVEERYYRCFVLGFEITASIADDSEFADRDFWLTFEPHRVMPEDRLFLDGIADWVARVLALEGFEVVRPLEPGRAGTGAVLYRRDPCEEDSRIAVITEDL